MAGNRLQLLLTLYAGLLTWESSPASIVRYNPMRDNTVFTRSAIPRLRGSKGFLTRDLARDDAICYPSDGMFSEPSSLTRNSTLDRFEVSVRIWRLCNMLTENYSTPQFEPVSSVALAAHICSAPVSVRKTPTSNMGNNLPEATSSAPVALGVNAYILVRRCFSKPHFESSSLRLSAPSAAATMVLQSQYGELLQCNNW